jgi:urea transport system permease protein
MGLTAFSILLSRFTLALALAWTLAAPVAHAAGTASVNAPLLAPLVDGDTSAKLHVITQLGQIPDRRAAQILEAMNNNRLHATSQGRIIAVDANQAAVDAVTGETVSLPTDANTVMINNRMRRAIANALAVSQLFSEDRAQRLAAARAMQHSGNASTLHIVDDALNQETDAEVRQALEIVRASLQLKSTDPAERIHAITTLGDTGNGAFRSVLQDILSKDVNGVYIEQDEAARSAATSAVASIDRHLKKVEWAGNLFYGLSLGSVLLLAALGLAITFGLMGVINMAHGELLMIGAYITYITQLAFRLYAPAWIDWYVIAALPLAFLASAAVGMALERSVIRWLYGRPLETLLATWGISLILMQAVRTLFGAQNVEVSNPAWMSGGMTIMGGLVLSYNRIAIIIFALLVVFFIWLLLNHTRLGLFIRAITQDRRMADCVGVPTGRIDMLAFGLGSGIAGLGGVALSQLGNVGPDLGRGYIVDSFMVVVLGGVGQLAGTVIAAFGLGSLSKFIEPWTGAVIAKITILVLIVLFVQKRPQGLFAPRGRSVE